MVKFDLYFESNIVAHPETIKIGIDSTTVQTTNLPVDHITFSIDLDSGAHTFWIELCGKSQENELRHNGELINDTYLQLINLAINGSMMHHLLHDLGSVTPDWQHHSDVANWFKENRGSVPERLIGSKYINLKGVYKFNFELPIKTFLNNQIKIASQYQNLYNAPLTEYARLKEKILRKF